MEMLVSEILDFSEKPGHTHPHTPLSDESIRIAVLAHATLESAHEEAIPTAIGKGIQTLIVEVGEQIKMYGSASDVTLAASLLVSLIKSLIENPVQYSVLTVNDLNGLEVSVALERLKDEEERHPTMRIADVLDGKVSDEDHIHNALILRELVDLNGNVPMKVATHVHTLLKASFENQGNSRGLIEVYCDALKTATIINTFTREVTRTSH